MGVRGPTQENSQYEIRVHSETLRRLKKVLGPGVTDDDSRKIIEFVRKVMREDLDDFEKKQQVIGTKYLFR